MDRRRILLIAGGLILTALSVKLSPFIEVFRRAQAKLIPPPKEPLVVQRTEAPVNPAGQHVSLELALNSRCTSDLNGNQKIFHWGLFDPQRKLAPDDIKALIDRVQIPRFTDGMLHIEIADNQLIFLMANESDRLKRSWMMIESGMQQQLVCLLCAAFGIGMVFKGRGDDGSEISDTVHANVAMQLDAMQPSYDGSFWCDSPPQGPRPWLQGNLPAPDRKGQSKLNDLISTQAHFDYQKINKADRTAVGQLLWAARGRTPTLLQIQAMGDDHSGFTGRPGHFYCILDSFKPSISLFELEAWKTHAFLGLNCRQ